MRLLHLLAALVAVVPAAWAGSVRPPPTLLLHLSDIHYSTNVRKYWNIFGDREGDAALWASQLVPRLGPPQAVMVTGDITDSKTAPGAGLQQEVEWLSYAGLLSNLSAAGVPLDRVYDVPGNHDTFNMPVRGGPNDFFAKHSAEGQRRKSTQQRVYVHRVPASGGGGSGSESTGADADACPAAWLLGLDPTPEPGLRSPTNFAGLARPAMMAQVHAALLGIEGQQPQGCGPPLILAYCHYPLSTIDSSPVHSAGPLGILVHATHPARAMQGLTELLASNNVSAVFSGHLHSSFGQRLHRVHATPGGGYMADLETAAWKDDRRFRLVAVDGGHLTFLELMFHTRNTPRMRGRSDAAAMQDPGWQEAHEQRGWAVTALDPSAAVIEHIVCITSPSDGRYSPLGGPAATAAAAARQGASGSEGKEGQAPAQGDGWVRALVFSLDAPAGADSAAQVDAELAGYLPDGTQLFSKPMQLVSGSTGAGGGSSQAGSGAPAPQLFEAQGEVTISCVGQAGGPAGHCFPPAEVVHVQVSAKGASGRTSRSPLQPVALRCAPLTSSHQRCWVAPVVGEPLPLNVTFLEWLGLAWNWPVLVHRLFLLVWALQVGAMLVAPRLLGRAVLPRIAASPALQCCPGGQQLPSTPRAAAHSGPASLLAQGGRTVASHLLWPVAALFLCASVTEVWSAMLAYSLYLLAGPWCLYTALSGYQQAMLFHFGVVGRLDVASKDHQLAGPAGAAWHFIGTPDTMFVVLVHFVVCVLPATLWVACVVARRLQLPYSPLVTRCSSGSDSSSTSSEGRRRMEAGDSTSRASSASMASRRSSSGSGGGEGGGAGRFSFSGPQLAALLALAALNWAGVYHKAYLLMGLYAVLASPGLTWTLPLAVLLVTAWGGPRRPGGPSGKGE